MPRKPVELPPAIAHAFVRNMKDFFAANNGNGIKADEIAAHQLFALKQHYSGQLKLKDVKKMFVQMREKA